MRYIRCLLVVLACLLWAGVSGASNLTVETNTNRGGIDYSNFNLSSALPDLCLAACAKDSKCKAYTYVKPGIQGAQAKCWLKSGRPTASSDTNCTSGIKTDKVTVSSETNINRGGSDYKNFNLSQALPDLCLAACAKEANCKAYTYVKPGVQGAQAKCWLKSGVPAASSSTNCVSGVKTVALEQARSFAITTWDGNCGGSQRDWWDDMCMAWRHKMGAKGWEQWWNNFSNVRTEKFADNSKVAWGADDEWNGMDSGEAALICTHGGHSAATGWSGSMHTNDGHGCSINTTQMMVGPASGGSTRFLHLSSCNSMNWHELDMWWAPAAGRVHVITGFHGYMYIGSQYVDEYDELADGGFSTGVGHLWMDKMYHEDHWYNSYNNLCPIALGFGETAAQSQNALNEKYNDRWPDRAPVYRTVSHYSGCSPDGADQLP